MFLQRKQSTSWTTLGDCSTLSLAASKLQGVHQQKVALWLQVYEMAIDTILLSFCEDCESHDGDPQCAPLLLLGAIGKQVLVKERKLTKKETEAQAKQTKELSRNKELYRIKAHSASGPAI